MLNKQQIKLVQTAARAAGLRTARFDGKYRFLLSQYAQSNGQRVTSCKQLNNWQLDDFLAICEAHGWRMPGKPTDYYRRKIIQQGNYASFAQQSAVRKLAKDLGWDIEHLNNFISKMTNKPILNLSFASGIVNLQPAEAYKIIEALKAMLGRETGKKYSSLTEVQKDMEAVTDGKGQQTS